jgi:hypothetical protein
MQKPGQRLEKTMSPLHPLNSIAFSGGLELCFNGAQPPR